MRLAFVWGTVLMALALSCGQPWARAWREKRDAKSDVCLHEALLVVGIRSMDPKEAQRPATVLPRESTLSEGVSEVEASLEATKLEMEYRFQQKGATRVRGLTLPLEATLDDESVWHALQEHRPDGVIYVTWRGTTVSCYSLGCVSDSTSRVDRDFHVSVYQLSEQGQLVEVYKSEIVEGGAGETTFTGETARRVAEVLLQRLDAAGLSPPCVQKGPPL